MVHLDRGNTSHYHQLEHKEQEKINVSKLSEHPHPSGGMKYYYRSNRSKRLVREHRSLACQNKYAGVVVSDAKASKVNDGLWYCTFWIVVVVVVVVVVVFFTLTDRASTIPSNLRGCQSGTWSQRGTKVNDTILTMFKA